jgi:hypothetical protein
MRGTLSTEMIKTLKNPRTSKCTWVFEGFYLGLYESFYLRVPAQADACEKISVFLNK